MGKFKKKTLNIDNNSYKLQTELRALQKQIKDNNAHLKNIQDELIKAKQEAKQAKQAKNEFLTNINHEIRTPLNAVIGLSYLALQTKLTSKQQDYLTKIQTASYILLDVINDMLDISNIKSDKSHIKSCKFEDTTEKNSLKLVLEKGEKNPDYKALENIQKACILLVEDNIINQQVASELIEKQGMSVTIANNGKEAVELLNDLHFDLVLMDIQMPEMDGIQATKIIRSNPNFKDLPVIAMTAHSLKEDSENFLQIGMNDHIVKPVNPKKLFDTLIKWIKNFDESKLKIDKLKNKKNFPNHLPGIDIQTGLNNVSGNEKKFRKLVLQFGDEFGSAAEQMRQILKNGELEKGERLVHNLKGVSGNLGALDLYSIAELFEHALKCCASDNFQKLIEQFDKSVKQVMESVNILKNLKYDYKKISANEKLDMAELPDLLNKINIMLNESELIEEEIIAKLYNNVGKSRYMDDVKKFESYIEVFDYENALKALKKLAKSLKIPIIGDNNE